MVSTDTIITLYENLITDSFKKQNLYIVTGTLAPPRKHLSPNH